VPKDTIKLEGKQAQSMLKLYDLLEEHDDVQSVYGNYEIDDEE
jgi:transcriptional/translational regulatory protein YebC/TACO1